MRADRQTDRMTDSTTTVCLSSSALGIIRNVTVERFEPSPGTALLN